MITVSDGFKNAMKASARELKALLTDGVDEITDVDDLQSIKIISEGNLCRTVMKEAQATFFGSHDYLDTYVNIGIGVKKVDTTYEYINYGAFRVVEQNYDKENESITIKAYDRMYEALQVFDITPTYPITMAGLVTAICTELGWTLLSDVFPNSTRTIESDLFTSQKMSYRDVLNQIAEASGSIIYFDKDDKLAFRQVSDTILETLTTDDVNSLKIESVYGELNSVVLSRQPQEDNIVQKDDESIVTYGLNEFKIINNSIVDDDRESWITAIYNTLHGIKYYPFEANTQGLGYFEVGDRIKVTDMNNNQFEVVIMSITLSMTGGLIETISAKVPEKSTTPYQYAGVIGQTIKKTEIRVNKVEGDITALTEEVANAMTLPKQPEPPESPEVDDMYLDTDDNVIYRWNGEEWLATGLTESDLENYYTKDETNAQIGIVADGINMSVEATHTLATSAQALAEENSEDIVDIQSNITELQIDQDSLEVAIQGIGGTNLIKNSVGLKGSIEEWQEFDGEGNLIDTDNNGTILNTSDIVENSESGSAIRIDEQFIVQTFSTISGGSYTFFCRFKKLGELVLQISGITGDIPITAGGYVDETWAVFKYSFTATSPSTTIKITNVESGTGSYAILTDTVCKLGEVNGWIQAPNEVYGRNFRFDEDGFSVTSLTDTFKAVLDNTKLGIYDTSSGSDKNMALFSKDSGLITKLVAQDELVVQRYENSTKAVRFIPTSTGLMIAVND